MNCSTPPFRPDSVDPITGLLDVLRLLQGVHHRLHGLHTERVRTAGPDGRRRSASALRGLAPAIKKTDAAIRKVERYEKRKGRCKSTNTVL